MSILIFLILFYFPLVAKASLTACRTAANAIYVTPLLQAEIDEMSGALHCEETDYTTSYSYFLEAFDAYDQNNQPQSALSCLKYMVLAKVLNNQAHEIPAILSSKLASKYAGKEDLVAMNKIASAAKAKSLEAFRQVVSLILSKVLLGMLTNDVFCLFLW